ncbi:MAG: adenylate/guanylate cyclase domain-containing protein [Vampirovibrionia bacterium]
MFSKIIKYKKYFDLSTIISVSLIIVVMFGFFCLYFVGFIDYLETVNYNLKSIVSANSNKDIKPDSNIVILDINNDSFIFAEEYKLDFGQWPWPRDVMAEAIEYLHDAKVKAVIYRINLKNQTEPEEDRAFVESVKKIDNFYATVSFKGLISSYLKEIESDYTAGTDKYHLNFSDEELDKYIKQYGFEQTIRKINSLLISKVVKEDIPEKYKVDVTVKDLIENSSVMDNITFVYFYSLAEIFNDAVSRIGMNYFILSDDSSISSDTPLYRYERSGEYYPSLGFAPYIDMWGKGKAILTPNYIETAGKKIPIDNKGMVKINYRNMVESYPKYRLIDVILTERYLKGEKLPEGLAKQSFYVDPAIFKDKIVIIGMTHADKESLNNAKTPTGKVISFSNILANQLDTYINCGGKNREQFIKQVPFYIVLLITLVFCIVASVLIIKFESVLNKLAVIFLSIILLVVITYGIFVIPELKYDMPLLIPVFVVFIVSISTFFWQYKKMSVKKYEIEKLFGKFVSPQVKKVLMDDPSLINYEGQKKEMTILFCDLRGFTTISESYPTNQIVLQLNRYFSEMVNIIVNQYNGTLDKYIGDAIMAFWNDPVNQNDHAELAVKAACAMVVKMKELNKEWVEKGWPELNIGVGINTGEVIVGHLGGEILLDYTVIGDNVNIASRLESMNKIYSTSILISEATRSLSQEAINTKFVAEEFLKGKKNSVAIYEVVSLK